MTGDWPNGFPKRSSVPPRVQRQHPKWLIWFSGRTLALADDVTDAQDVAKLSHIGSGLIFSAFGAATSWAISSTWLTHDSSDVLRCAIAAAFALVGAVIVTGFDRPALFAAEMSSKPSRIRWLRWPLIGATALLAALKVTSLFLAGDLAASAAAERQDRAISRVERTEKAFDLTGGEVRRAEAAGEVQRLRQATVRVPEPILAELRAADECWRNVQTRRRALIASGLPARAAQRQTGAAAGACTAMRQRADHDSSEYLAGIKVDLVRAREAQAARDREANDAQKRADELRQAGNVADANITAGSVSAMWRLLGVNWLAWVYVGVFWAVWMIVDGLGLLVGEMMGRTTDGWRLQRNYDRAVVGYSEDILRSRQRRDRAAIIAEALSQGARTSEAQAAFVDAGSWSASRSAYVVACASVSEGMAADLARANDAMVEAEMYAPGAGEMVEELLGSAIRRSRTRV